MNGGITLTSILQQKWPHLWNFMDIIHHMSHHIYEKILSVDNPRRFNRSCNMLKQNTWIYSKNCRNQLRSQNHMNKKEEEFQLHNTNIYLGKASAKNPVIYILHNSITWNNTMLLSKLRALYTISDCLTLSQEILVQ